MDLPQGNARPYELKLWKAVVMWNYRYAAGARFYQFQAGQTTLLIDTRFDDPKAYLLRGAAHRIHDRLRRALPRARLEDPAVLEGSWEDAFGMAVEDICLSQIAGRFQPEVITGPQTLSGIDDFLRALVDRGIVLEIDDRYLALAVECANPEDAARLGLGEFASRRAGDAEETSSEPTVPALDPDRRAEVRQRYTDMRLDVRGM